MNIHTISFLLILLLGSTVLFGQETLPDVYVVNNHGESINLKEYVSTGSPKVVSLWATWCGPCRMELNALKKVSERWKKEYNVEIIAVSVDIPQMVGRARKMLETNGWNYTFMHDAKQELMAKLGIQNIPYSMLIDGKGRIQSVQMGYYHNYEKQLEQKIKKLQKL